MSDARGASGDAALRILVVTAGMGAGHTAVADELARRLRARGASVDVVDMLAAAGAPGARLQRTYRLLLDRAPWLYEAAMRCWLRWPAVLERITAVGSGPFVRALTDAARRSRPHVIVSTYNLTSQLLGRHRGEFGVPLVTVVPDPGPHPYWVSPGVDLHLAPTADCAAGLARYGARRVEQVPPVLRPEFADPPTPAAARARLKLPGSARIAVLSAGSWAVGGIEGTLDVISGVPGVLPVVLCGRDAALAQRLQARAGVAAVPWTADVISYLAAADVVVDNAGGVSCWEALSCATPVLMYRPLPGHGRLNAAALARTGLVRHVHSARELADAVAGVAARTGSTRTLPSWVGREASEHIEAAARVPLDGPIRA